MQLLTASRMTSLLTCPRQHYWRYEVGLQATADGAALRFGSAWHRAMEARWRGAEFDVALAAAIPAGCDLDETQAATLSGLLAGYWAMHPFGDCNVRELHPEIEFCLPLAGSRTFQCAGKIDGLGVLHDGRLVLIEHKTTSDDLAPDSDYWLRLRANGQIMQYVLAARALGWQIEIILYDVTRKPAIRPKQGETPEAFGERLAADTQARPAFYFARREVPVLDQDLEEFQVQRLELARQILSLRRAEKRLRSPAQAWPRNVNGLICRGCPFSGFCLQNVTVNPAQPPAGFRCGPVHGELTAAQPERKELES